MTVNILLLAAAIAGGGAEGRSLAGVAPAPVQAVGDSSQGGDDRDIVVWGIRLRGAAAGAEPIRSVDEREIESFGESSVAGVVAALEPQTRGASEGARRQVVLLNGSRIADFSEISSLPAEAVERIDILPEETALAYGYPIDSRVLNVVLRERFEAMISDNSASAATGGGRSAFGADWSVARIGGSRRLSLAVQLSREAALTSDERSIEQPVTHSLLPSTTTAIVSGSFSAPFTGRTTMTMAGRLSYGTTESDLGTEPSLTTRRTTTWSGRLGATFAGDLGLWRWSAVAQGDRSDFETIDRHSENAASARYGFAEAVASADMLLNGPLLRLPAGDALATVRARAEYSGFQPRSSPQTERRLMSMSGSIDVPLLRRGNSPIGELALSASLTLSEVSRYGGLATWGGALRWSPRRRFSITASYLDDDGFPSLRQLAEPVVATPDVPVFDPVRGESVAVTRLDGGNDGLGPNNRRERKIEAVLRPPGVGDLLLSVNYSEVDLRNPIVTVPIVLPDLESAFPERFQRDQSGRLLLIDARTATVAASSFRGMRWGFQYSMPFGGGEAQRRLQIGLFDTWRFENRIHIRRHGPVLDLLRGAALGSSGGLPRHLIEFQGTLLVGGSGLRVEASRQSPTVIRAGGTSAIAGSDLFYSPRSRVDVRLFRNLGAPGALPGMPSWLRSGRLTISVENLFNRRPRVHDAAGTTPLSLQPTYLEPLGRNLRVSFRTSF